ncbi:hypothetical protein [Bdellovibrio sp. KM01]|uniref:hypothetical protein n=1 Tax=Bdellovibrio sp. KM01 TaxID=2748865 RepID=UPI0015E94527|nr:hypothetical protein [Bdellovibrio sp. KM01]QLY26815.1 hypothetical protein HW988_07405 [Bdellovibrio sp. KM01]
MSKILEFREGNPSMLFRFLQFLAGKKPDLFQLQQHQSYSAELLKDANAAFFSFEQARLIYPSLQILPAQVRMLECFDFYFPEDGKWYPRLLYYEAIHRVLVGRARDLNIRVPAFVVGEGECLRIAAAVCTELGFSEIYLIGENTTQLHREARILSRSNLGIKFKVLPIEELTIQAVSASLIINTVHLKHESELLKDLSYFNFMNTGGYAFDCNLGNLQSELMEEAERAELKVLQPSELLQALVEIVFEKLKQSELLEGTDLTAWVREFKEQNSSSV